MPGAPRFGGLRLRRAHVFAAARWRYAPQRRFYFTFMPLISIFHRCQRQLAGDAARYC